MSTGPPREAFMDRGVLARICVRQRRPAEPHANTPGGSRRCSSGATTDRLPPSLAHAEGVIAEAEGRHLEAVTILVAAAEQCAAVAIPTWVAGVVDDLATFTAVDDDARQQLREAVAALRAGTMDLSDVLSIVHATTRRG